jgi:drug/metabolite transporter (DMT)-like permease
MTMKMNKLEHAAAVPLGYAAALAVVLVTACYPALTRLALTTALTPADLLLFRLGIAGVIFAPLLVRHRREITRSDWLSALPLSFLHGWGMAGCVIFGLQFAPASHAAALGPGAIAAWIALIGFLVYRIEVHSARLAGIAIIVGGVVMLLAASSRGEGHGNALVGDAMFLAASALGATYLVYIQRRRLNPVIAAALVCVASAMIVGPWHYFFATSAISTASFADLAWQLAFQGVLVGSVTFFALNYAVLAIGSQTVGVLSALVPVAGALCAVLLTRDRISTLEWVAIIAISLGVAIGCLPRRAASNARQPGGRKRAPRSFAATNPSTIVSTPATTNIRA